MARWPLATDPTLAQHGERPPRGVHRASAQAEGSAAQLEAEGGQSCGARGRDPSCRWARAQYRDCSCGRRASAAQGVDGARATTGLPSPGRASVGRRTPGSRASGERSQHLESTWASCADARRLDRDPNILTSRETRPRRCGDSAADSQQRASGLISGGECRGTTHTSIWGSCKAGSSWLRTA